MIDKKKPSYNKSGLINNQPTNTGLVDKKKQFNFIIRAICFLIFWYILRDIPGFQRYVSMILMLIIWFLYDIREKL